MDLVTWNPNQSEQVREILAHATEEERREFAKLSGRGGFMIAIGCGIAFGPIVAMAVYTGLQSFTPLQWFVVIGGVAIGLGLVIAIILRIRRNVRETLVEFDWAKRQGITKDTLKLDRWN